MCHTPRKNFRQKFVNLSMKWLGPHIMQLMFIDKIMRRVKFCQCRLSMFFKFNRENIEQSLETNNVRFLCFKFLIVNFAL
jgi:hypothetical protein